MKKLGSHQIQEGNRVPQRSETSDFLQDSSPPHMAPRPCGQHTAHSSSWVPQSILCALPRGMSNKRLLRATTVERIEHVAICARSALGVAGVQHVAHVQPASLRSTWRGSGRRCHTPWLRGAALRNRSLLSPLNWRHTSLVGSHGRLVRLHRRVR